MEMTFNQILTAVGTISIMLAVFMVLCNFWDNKVSQGVKEVTMIVSGILLALFIFLSVAWTIFLAAM